MVSTSISVYVPDGQFNTWQEKKYEIKKEVRELIRKRLNESQIRE